MESAEPFPEGAVNGPDLRALVERAGPFLSVYLHTDPDVGGGAPYRSEQRWKTLRSELESSGAPEPMLGEVEPLVSTAHRHGRMLGVVTAGPGSIHVEHGDPFGVQDLGRFAPTPHLVPIIRWRQAALPHVVVLIDRTGADVFAIEHGAPEVEQEVQGKEQPVTKVHAGGWSQRRYQERAENTWEENAETVAEAVERLVRRIDAELIAVAGDVRAVGLLRDALHKDLQPLMREVSGDRPRGKTGDPIPDEVGEVVEELVNEQTTALLDRFRQELGQGDLAVEGTGAVVAALERAQVQILLLAENPDDESQTLWIGDQPTALAVSSSVLRQLGVEEPVEAPRSDALVRAALATDAAIRVVGPQGAPAEGAGALLRSSDEATTES